MNISLAGFYRTRANSDQRPFPASVKPSTEGVVHIVDNDEGAWKDTAAMLETALGCRIECYASGQAFLENLSIRAPGCVLLGVRMPELDGIAIQREINQKSADMAVILVAAQASIGLAVRAMKAGAVDFFEKPYVMEDLIEAVAQALSSSKIGNARAAMARTAQAKVSTLSPRERRVMQGLVAGHANKVMAYQLGISIRTVEMHRARLMDKLAAVSVSHLVQMALAADLEPLQS